MMPTAVRTGLNRPGRNFGFPRRHGIATAIVLSHLAHLRPMAVRILFVCHGNICRSPMAEFVMKDMAEKEGVRDMFEISSCATSSEELGNDIHYGTKQVLDMHGIPYTKRCARRMNSEDYARSDYIVAMDRQNIRNMKPFVGDDPEKKVSLLMEHAGQCRDVGDPWYSGDFTGTYRDICRGCRALMDEILKSTGGR